uniref:Uncharacterized protein n=1 Tax=Panagrolaimus davidi TaxID=227884 RepID=A0A914QCM9_9BILA
MAIAQIPSLEDDLSYFDTKIEHKMLYLESLKKAAEQEIDPIRGQWFDSAIDNIQDLLNILAYCKSKFQATATLTTLRRSTFATSPSSPATSSSYVKPRRSSSVGPVKRTPPSAVTPLVILQLMMQHLLFVLQKIKNPLLL